MTPLTLTVHRQHSPVPGALALTAMVRTLGPLGPRTHDAVHRAGYAASAFALRSSLVA